MSKIKKYGSIIIIAILLTMVASSVFAKYIDVSEITSGKNIGNKVITRGYSTLVGKDYLYCIQHGKKLKSELVTYIVSNYIEIDGNTAYDSKGNVINTKEINGQMAYILSQKEGYGAVGAYTNTQLAVYEKFNEWVESIGLPGYKYAGNDAKSVAAPSNNILKDAEEYASQISDITIEASKDNTEKDNITYTLYKGEDGKPYYRVGPFKWTYSGKISEFKVYDENGQEINAKVSVFSGKEEKFGIENMESGKAFYVTIDGNSDVRKITKIKAKQENPKEIIKAKIWLLTNPDKQNLLAAKTEKSEISIEDEFSFDYDIPLRVSLKILKVDKLNREILLKDVEFKIKNSNTNLYVKKSESGKITYVPENEATIFKTDDKGEINIDNLLEGKYIAYETKNPNYGYELPEDGFTKRIEVDNVEELLIPENEQKYVKLGGYVWQDNMGDVKDQTTGGTDNLYYAYGTSGSRDQLIKGITVNLKDSQGNVIQTAITDDNGAYEFIDVLIEKLNEYYVEFVYDGFTYTPVTTTKELRELENSSKVGEVSKERDILSNKFTTVTGTSDIAIDKGQANSKEQKEVDLSYTRTIPEGSSKYVAKYNNDIWSYSENEALITATKNQDTYNVSANTSVIKYNLKELYENQKATSTTEKLSNINLGVRKREQSNAIIYSNDIESVKLTINGYSNVYKYGQKALKEQAENGLNVAANISSYKRYIYTSDIHYNETHKDDKRLRVYVTYKVTLKNASNTLYMDINELVDYYDAKYKTGDIKVGTQIHTADDENYNNIENPENLVVKPSTYATDKYNAVYITKQDGSAIARLAPNESKDIYVQYELSDEEVLDILNGERTVDNIAEINSYTTYEKVDDTYKLYAAVDNDSAAGNAKPDDRTTFENDTDSAPTLTLKAEGARSLAGTTFEDTTTGEFITGQIREGDGEYKEEEPVIAGVAVKMVENDDSSLTYTTTTDENGNFTLNDFVPGNYTITYEWGNDKYTVQNYKATIYKDKDRQNNKEWYKTETPRYSDAMDNYTTRQNIDKEITTIQNSTTTTIDKMTSITPTLGIGIEYDKTETASMGNKYTYQIKNVDLGIVERARQSVKLEKHVSYIKLIVGGQVLVEGDPRNEKLDYVIYLPPTDTDKGIVQITLDSELIHGATLEIQYELTLTNNSELDYIDENFYNYGSSSNYDKNKVVKITSAAIIDYVDNELKITENNGDKLNTITVENLVADGLVSTDEELQKLLNEHTTIVTMNDYNEISIAPTETTSAKINLSKLLSNEDDLSYNNSGEVVKVTKTGGSMLRTTIGTYKLSGEIGADAETTIVVPPTGQTRIYYIIGGITLIILAAGIVIINKKVLNK